tara:strand:+ start:11054 stop:11704 length:651 start_codon:yes stop_codon:yes gene_type:complete
VDILMKKLLSFLILIPMFTWADDNHVHVEQVVSGSVDLDITQIGYDNTINFSFAHSGNDFNFSQVGNGNSISWVSYWGSGKAWGGDVDGSNNDEDVSQTGGATYGRHIWGNNNDVDVYQNGTHTHNIDIHTDDVDHDAHQSGTGSHYSHVYYYGSQDGSVVNLMQKDGANHNAQIRLQGNYPTTLNLLQQGNSNKSYTLTQNCQNSNGCSISVTQE